MNDTYQHTEQPTALVLMRMLALLLLMLGCTTSTWAQETPAPATAADGAIAIDWIADAPAPACVGATARYDLKTAATTYSYLWQVSMNGGKSFEPITAAMQKPSYAGFESASLIITDLTSDAARYQYRTLIWDNQCNCDSLQVDQPSLTVRAAPKTPFVETLQSFCASEGATVADLDAQGIAATWTDELSRSNTLHVTQELVDGTRYYAQATQGTCKSELSAPVLVRIEDVPAPRGEPLQQFCSLDKPVLGDFDVDAAAIVWYASAKGDITLSENTLMQEGITYYAAQQGERCESADRGQFRSDLNDAVAPEARCQDIIVELDSMGNAVITPFLIDAGSTDDCGVDTMYLDTYSFTCAEAGTSVTVTLTVVDAAGNSDTCQSQVDVEDNMLPYFDCTQPITQDNDAGACGANVFFTPPSIQDNCLNITANPSGQVPGDFFNVGTVFVGYSATNPSNGQAITCFFPVEIEDVEAPTFDCQANDTLAADASCQAFTPDYLSTLVITDNCDALADLTITQSPTAGTPLSGATSANITVEDQEGNITSCDFMVVVEDQTDPVIDALTCPGEQDVLLDANCEYVLGDYTGSLTITDNCSSSSDITVTQFPPAGEVFDVAGDTQTITLTVTDLNGNESICSFDLVVLDDSDPQIDPATCPGDQTVALDDDCQFVLPDYTTGVVVTDNCVDPSGVNVTQTPMPGNVLTGDGSVHAITVTANDGNGNTTSCSFDITLEDQSVPVFTTCQENDTVSTGAACSFVLPDYTASVVVEDNCDGLGVVTMTQFPVGGTTILGTTTVIITATDPHGVQSTCEFLVVMEDDIPPVIDPASCPGDMDVVLDAMCAFTLPDYTTGISVTDNCTSAIDITINQVPPAGTVITGHNATQLVTITVTDDLGNTTECSFQLTALDQTGPVLDCPGDITMIVPEGLSQVQVTYPIPTATDNCSASTVQQTDGSVFTSGSDFPIGTTPQTYTATDANGNTSTCTFNVTVTDGTDPLIICPGDVEVDAPAGFCDTNVPINISIPIAIDNDSIVSVINDYNNTGNASDVYPVGVTDVTWTATDNSGNTATCTMTVTVFDVTPPNIIICPSDLEVTLAEGECEVLAANVNLVTPTATDECGSLMITNNAPDTFFVGQTTIIWVVTDGAGNTGQCIQLVDVIDSFGPDLGASTCPNDTILDSSPGICGRVFDYEIPTATDDCGDVTVTLAAGLSPNQLFPTGTTTVTYHFVDDNDNLTVCSFDVTVNDTEPPVFPNPVVVVYQPVAGSCEAIATWEDPVATDNCPGVTTTLLSGSGMSGDVFPVGTTTFVYQAVDVQGLTTQLTVEVVVEDTESPLITACPSDTIILAAAGLCEQTFPLQTPTATDNCGSVSFTNDALSVYPVGTSTVTWVITDGSGNTSICAYDVTVVDDQLPFIICPQDVEVDAIPGECEAEVNLQVPIATDNCEVDSLWNDATGTTSSLATLPLGENTVTWTAVDLSGNTISCPITVTVNGAGLDPESSCPEDIEVNNDSGECGANVTVPQIDITTLCDAASITNDFNGTDNASDFYPVGETIVTWTVNDIHGGSSQCSMTVTVVDIEAPIANCQEDYSLGNIIDECQGQIPIDPSVISDNCGIVETIRLSGPAELDLVPLGAYDMEYIYLDAAGNSATCAYTVTFADVQPPTIVCPPNIVQADSIVFYDLPIFSDNCSAELILIDGPASGTEFDHDTTLVGFTVADPSGNMSSCVMSVLVNQRPVAVNDTLILDEMAIVELGSSPLIIDVLDNDYDLDGDSIFIVQILDSLNNTSYASDTTLAYLRPDDFCGEVTFQYVISDIFGALDTAEVYIDFDCYEEVFIPEGFSPNNDGVNDVLYILGLVPYPDNILEIYNRYGHIVYEAEGYQNDWDGRSEGDMSLGGNYLPRGTYFYILLLGDGEEVHKGFLYINPR